jgi:hypothetical protein
LIHPHDGLEGANRRIDLAKKYLNDFGIAAVCGFGRKNPRELGNILELLKAAAGSLAKTSRVVEGEAKTLEDLSGRWLSYTGAIVTFNKANSRAAEQP